MNLFEDSNETSGILKKITTPCLLFLGLFGNLISIKIFKKKSFSKLTTFQYLSFLSIIDLLTLLAGCGHLVIESFTGLDIRLLNDYTCKIHSFIVYFSTHLSSMLLALMTIERTKKILTNKCLLEFSAFKSFCILALITFAIDFHFLLFAKIIEINNHSLDFLNWNLTINSTSTNNLDYISPTLYCLCDDDTFYYEYLVHYFPWIDMLAYAVIPGVIMSICSVIIIVNTFKTTKNKLITFRKNGNPNKIRRNKQVYSILLTTNAFFFCLVSPVVLINLLMSNDLIPSSATLTTIAYILAYSNHALNFIFYGIGCEKYRRSFFEIIRQIVYCYCNLPDSTVGNVTSLSRNRRQINKSTNFELTLKVGKKKRNLKVTKL